MTPLTTEQLASERREERLRRAAEHRLRRLLPGSGWRNTFRRWSGPGCGPQRPEQREGVAPVVDLRADPPKARSGARASQVTVTRLPHSDRSLPPVA